MSSSSSSSSSSQPSHVAASHADDVVPREEREEVEVGEGEGEEEVEEGREAEVEPKESAWQKIWRSNQGAFLILLSEVLGSSMDAIVRFLQQGGGGGMHPFQLMFARTSVIFVLSTFTMWWTSVPDFLLGKRSVRGWLVLRSACGFTGLLCFYYSVHYLPLAETTIFRFLVPIPTAFICSLIFGTVFTRRELLAGLIALFGVIIIAQYGEPTSNSSPDSKPSGGSEVDDVSPAQRILALSIMTLGIFGTVGAYTTIRIIGSQAHALISVNYFAVLGMITSGLALLFLPGVHFVMPPSPKEWILLLLLGILGFSLQFLLTKGLQLDRSSKATSMMYTQIIFALIFDWAIWRVVPTIWSWVGGAIVIGSTLWAALMKEGEKKNVVPAEDEERALLGSERTEDVRK